MRKLLAILLTVAMLLSVVCVMPTAVAAEEVDTTTETNATNEEEIHFGVDEASEAISSEESDDELVFYAEIEKYAGDKNNSGNILEQVTEKYDASFASALSYYIDVDEFKEYLIDALDTCTTSQVSISNFYIPTSKWNDLCNLIFYDTPELFHVRKLSGSYSGSYLTSIYVKEYPTYCDTAAEYTSLMNGVQLAADELLSGIKDNNYLTNLQKIILLHDRIATYCEYDPNQLSNGDYRDQDYSMTGVFVDKVAVCQGYASAYNYLLKQIGIESYQCRSTDLCHAWNLVKVGSYFYHVDITWDDTYSDALDIKGRVMHQNFLRSNTGIYNTGHKAYDYDRPTNNSTYDSYFWQNSDAEFVVVGNQVYYYDKTCGDLKTYSGTVKSNQNTWAYGRILADGNYIYITTSNSVKRYDTTTNITTTVYTPSLYSGYEIYSLYKSGNDIYCGIGSTSSSTLTTHKVATSTVALTANSSYEAGITKGGQEKIYSFTPSVSGKYVIYSNSNYDTKVTLCNANGNAITSDDDSGAGSNFRLVYYLTAGTTYQYKVIFYNSSYTGTIPFKFGNVFTITYNANGGSGAPSHQEKDYGTDTYLSEITPTRSGYAFRGWSTVSTATTATYEPGDLYDVDANTTLYAVWLKYDNVPSINLNKTYRVTINSGSQFVKFTPTKTAEYIICSTLVEENSSSEDTMVSLYDKNGNLLASDTDSGEGSNFKLIHQLQAGQTYTYELSFSDKTCSGVFQFVFGETYAIKYSANGGSSAPNPSVKGYGVAEPLSDWIPTRKGYVFLGWSTNKKATSATYKRGETLPADINQSITLYAVWKKGSLGTTAVFKGKLLDYNTVKVFWRAVPGADGYRVYYKKASAKSYKYVGIITATSYTGDYTAGTKYCFKVIPCIKNNNGSYTNGTAKTLTYSTGRNLSTPSYLNLNLYGYDDVQLKWGKVSGATKYKIYYKTSDAENYTYKGMTASTSYKLSNLSDGKLYRIAVLPCIYVNGTYLDAEYMRWTEIYTLKKVPTPTILKYSSSKVEVRCDNILGETGYQISQSTSKTATKVVYTFKIIDPDSIGGYYKSIISAAKGKAYYYKVRAYKTENGKKIYGPWSTVVKYTVK